MKWRYLAVGGALLHASVLAAQSNDPPSKQLETYAFRVAVPVVECAIDGSPKGPATQAPPGAKFYFLQAAKEGTDVVIQFLSWAKSDPNYLAFNVDAGRGAERFKYFCVERGNFERFAERIYATWLSSRKLTVGALVLPVKLRRQPFDFSKDVTVGTTAGARMRMSPRRESYISLLGGVGLSSATLTSENTNAAVTTTTDRAALTWTVGAMFDVDRFQFGAFIGQDRVSQPNQSDWIYQGKTWLAVGLGYSLFGAESAKAVTGNQ